VESADAAAGTIVLRTADGQLIHGITCGRPIGKEGTFSVRTVHLSLSRERPAGAINVWPVSIIRSVFLGDFVQVNVRWGGQDLVVRQIGPPGLEQGEIGYLHVPPNLCALLEKSS
ncbi:MAG: hypothetical protein ABL904_03450, partial [Hyphomicrobiaceae bacterium]